MRGGRNTYPVRDDVPRAFYGERKMEYPLNKFGSMILAILTVGITVLVVLISRGCV